MSKDDISLQIIYLCQKGLAAIKSMAYMISVFFKKERNGFPDNLTGVDKYYTQLFHKITPSPA
jgi:hypothetical protein